MTSGIGAPSFDVVVVVGGSQAGLAVGYHLAQRGLRFVILDGGSETGHVWRVRWDSLTLFTLAQYSGLPGMAFPLPKDTYPSKDDVVTYLQSYVSAFDLPVLNARVTSLTQRDGGYVVATADEEFTASHVVVAGHSRSPSSPQSPATWMRRSSRCTAPTIETRLNCPRVVECSWWEEATQASRSPRSSPRPGRWISPSASECLLFRSDCSARTSSGGCPGSGS